MTARPDAIVPPPFVAQQLAWECAADLLARHCDKISLDEAVLCRAAVGCTPAALTWDDIATLRRIHRLASGGAA